MRTSEPAGNRDSPPAAFRVNRVRIDGVRAVDVPDRIEEFLRGGASHVVHFCPAHPTVLARDDPGYRAILNRGDLNLPDGASVVWAIGLLGGRVERVTGTDTFLRLCRAGEPRRWRHYLYGGAPAVVQQLRLRLEDEFPGILIVGAESPPFRPLDDGDLELAAERIRRSEAGRRRRAASRARCGARLPLRGRCLRLPVRSEATRSTLDAAGRPRVGAPTRPGARAALAPLSDR